MLHISHTFCKYTASVNQLQMRFYSVPLSLSVWYLDGHNQHHRYRPNGYFGLRESSFSYNTFLPNCMPDTWCGTLLRHIKTITHSFRIRIGVWWQFPLYTTTTTDLDGFDLPGWCCCSQENCTANNCQRGRFSLVVDAHRARFEHSWLLPVVDTPIKSSLNR